MKDKAGWLLRVYANKVEDVAGRVERVAKVVAFIRKVSDGPIVVLVPNDKDCGMTAGVVPKMISDVIVKEVTGSPNLNVLNHGLSVLSEQVCSHAIIVSNKSVEAITPEMMDRIWAAFWGGAKAVGVAFDEFAPIVKQGIILNTFAAYDLKALDTVGRFHYEHNTGGVEEVSLLLALIERYGQCLAVVESGVTADVHDSPEAQERYRKILDSKISRVRDLLQAQDLGVGHLTHAIMQN